MVSDLFLTIVLMYQQFQKFISHIIEMCTSAWGIIILALSTLFQALFQIDGFQFSLVALGVLYVADFLTGCAASWKEANSIKSWTFFESKRFRESISKGVTYFVFIAMGWFLYKIFLDEPIPIPFSSKGVNVIQIFFGICIAIESWSILENMKRLGFDLIGKISTTFKGFWTAKKQITDEE